MECSSLYVYLHTKTKNPFTNDFMVIPLEALWLKVIQTSWENFLQPAFIMLQTSEFSDSSTKNQMTLVRVDGTKQYPQDAEHCKDQAFLFPFGAKISPCRVIILCVLAHVHSAEGSTSFSFALLSCVCIYGVDKKRHFLIEWRHLFLSYVAGKLQAEALEL